MGGGVRLYHDARCTWRPDRSRSCGCDLYRWKTPEVVGQPIHGYPRTSSLRGTLTQARAAKTQQQADALAAREAIRRGRSTSVPTSAATFHREPLTFGTAYRDWTRFHDKPVHAGGWSESHMRSVRDAYEKRLYPLGPLAIDRPDWTLTLERFFDDLYRREVSPEGDNYRTVQNALRYAHVLFRRLHKRGAITYEPMADLCLPPDPKKVPLDDEVADDEREATRRADSAIDLAQYGQLLLACDNLEERIMLRIEVEAGLRRGELGALRWTTIDRKIGLADTDTVLVEIRRALKRGTITGGTRLGLTKTKRKRAIGITASLFADLEAYRIEMQERDLYGPDGFLFPGYDEGSRGPRASSKPMHPDTLTKRIKAICRRAGLLRSNGRPYSPQHLRASCASIATTLGASEAEVRQHLGHTARSTVTSEHYIHTVSPNDATLASYFDNVLELVA